MTAPLQPPMLRYIIHIGACYGKLDVVTDHRIDLGQKMPDWIEASEYNPDVEKSYWDAHLTPLWIRTKKINFIEFIGYVKPPKSEAFKP